MNAETPVLRKVSSSMRLMGWLSIIFGALAIAMPWIAGQSILLMSSAILTIMLSIYFFVDGLSEFFAAFSLQEGKGWLLFDAVVTVLLSIMIFTGFPLAGTVAIGVFLGIKLVFVGVTMLSIRSLAKNAL